MKLKEMKEFVLWGSSAYVLIYDIETCKNVYFGSFLDMKDEMLEMEVEYFHAEIYEGMPVICFDIY